FSVAFWPSISIPSILSLLLVVSSRSGLSLLSSRFKLSFKETIPRSLAFSIIISSVNSTYFVVGYNEYIILAITIPIPIPNTKYKIFALFIIVPLLLIEKFKIYDSLLIIY